MSALARSRIWPTWRRRVRGDDGSLLLAIMTLFIVGAVVAVTGALAITGQVQARSDTSFESALHVAETGLNRFTALVESAPFAPAPTAWVNQTVPGGTVSASATYSPAPPPSGDTLQTPCTNGTWAVQATGTVGTVSRNVSDEVCVGSAFQAAAFGKILTSLNGGNGADAFNSNAYGGNGQGDLVCLKGSTAWGTPSQDYVSYGADPGNYQMCNPVPFGDVGTNQELFLKGVVYDNVNHIDVFYAQAPYVSDPLPNATGYCKGDATTCSDPEHKITYHRNPYIYPPITVCDGVSATESFSGSGTLGSGVYGFTNVTLDNSTVFTGTVANPTILCVNGTLSVPNGEALNAENVVAPNGQTYLAPRPPGTLLIFSKYTNTGGSPGISFGNHSALSAAVFAPNASCDAGSQSDFFGSLVCNTVSATGGWTFHYDLALGQTTVNAPVTVRDYTDGAPHAG